MTPVRTALVALVLAALAGCGACDTVPATAVQDCSQSAVFAGHVKTDILFVVDDSGSMNDNQQNLASNLNAFIDRLASLPIEDDYQIGVTTTDVDTWDGGTNFIAGPENGNPYPRGALVAVTQSGGAGVAGDLVYDATTYPATKGWGGARILVKGSPTLIQDFNANVHVGTSGSNKEQPFRAIRMALTDRIADGTNAGFLRPGAKLAIVVLSDEDDCSDSPPIDIATDLQTGNDQCHTMTPYKDTLLDSVSEFASFLQGPIAGEQRDVVTGAIVGVAPGTLDLSCTTTSVCNSPPPTCTTCCGAALDRGDRYTWLLQAMGPARSRLASICDPSFAQALEDFATAIMSDTLPLDGAPADWRMLTAKVTKAAGDVTCRIASATDSSPAEISAADAIYTPPQLGGPSLTFQGNCALAPGDQINVNVICAG